MHILQGGEPPEVWEARRMKLALSPDDIVPCPEHLYLFESYEPEVMRVIDHMVRPNDFVVDAGAGIGFFSVLLGRKVGPEGLVLAFEPEEESFGHLYRNVHLCAELNNVACFPQALWYKDEELKLYSVGLLGYTSVFELYPNAERIGTTEGRSLDSLLIADQPNFIKIDCEGAELEILQGASRVLERGVDALVIELNFTIMKDSGRDRQIRALLGDFGYQMYLINVLDGRGGYFPPVLVDPEATIMRVEASRGAKSLNVMFCQPERLKERWND